MIELRPVRRQDAPRIASLLTQLGYPADAGDVYERLDYWLDDRANCLIGAEVDGELAGVAALHVCPALVVTGRWVDSPRWWSMRGVEAEAWDERWLTPRRIVHARWAAC